ncbi:hypothetical protein ES702_05821 [subsurface metagenome]
MIFNERLGMNAIIPIRITVKMIILHFFLFITLESYLFPMLRGFYYIFLYTNKIKLLIYINLVLFCKYSVTIISYK